MIRVAIAVEGRTEAEFVKNVEIGVVGQFENCALALPADAAME